MGSCYSAYSSKAVTISPSLPITRPIISSTSNNPWPSLPSTWPSFLLEVPEPVELLFKPIKVESETGAPPPFNTVKCLPVSALPTTATVSKGPSPASKSQSQQNNERSSIRKPKKVVNFKSPLTSPLRTPPERKIGSPKYSPPKSPIRRIPKEKHRKRLRLLSRIKEVVQQTREHSRNHINRSTKSTKSHVPKSDDDAEVEVNSRQTYNDYDEIATADAEVETEESLVVCFGSAADDNSNTVKCCTAEPVTVVTSYQVEYIEKVELTDLGDLTSSSTCSSDDEGIALSKGPSTSNPARASNNLVSRVGRGIRRSFLFKNKQSSKSNTMASTTAATASPVGKPLIGGSQLRAPATFTSTTTSQLAKLFNRAPTNSSTEKPPALPPKSSKLRAPTGLIKPTGGIPKLLVGSKSIGNVNAAASAADSTSKLSIRKDFSTANSCDNLTIPKHPRSSISDVSSDASTLSSASSVSSFKKVTPNNQNSSSSRLPSARSGFFDSSHRASVDSKLRSSSSSNISSADSGHHSASGTSSLASKSTHNLSHNNTTSKVNGATTKASLLPTSKSQNSLNSMNSRNLPAKPQSSSTLNSNSNSNGAPPPLPQKGIKPQTAHIVSTANMVSIDRSNVGLPRPPAQYPSASRFQQHQSALYSQRLNFLYGAQQPVPNGTYQNSQNHQQQPRPNSLPYHPEASTQSYKASPHPIASQTHPPMSNLASNSISVNNNQSSGLNRRILKSPSPHHGITNPELNKPYKRPQPTVASIPNTSTLSQHHIQQRQPQHQQQQPGHRYSNIQHHQSINPNSAQSSNSNQQPNQSTTNSNYYSANYVRNAVNRLNSTNPVSHLSRTSNNNRVQQPNQQPPALPPKTNGHHHHNQIHNPNPNQHYNQPTTHHPQFDQNGNPTTTYSPNRMPTIETETYLAHRTASLSLKDPHPMDHLNGNHHHYSPLNGQSTNEWMINGIQHSNGHDSSSSSDYSSLTYNVRTRRQNSVETTPTNQATRLMSTKNGLQDTTTRLNYTICDDDDNRQQAQQLATSAAAGASSLPVTSESSINNGSNSNNKRNHEMSFVAALVSRSKLAQTQQQQTHQKQTHEKQTHQQTHQQQQQTATQDDTDVEDDDMMMMEDMMMEGDEDEDISSSSTDASSCSATANNNSPHHKSRANQKASKTKSSNISSTHSSIMSASICSTASTTSSFCFENGGSNGVGGNSITSTDNSPVHSCSHHHRRPSKGRTESSASCTTISSTQESNKDFLIDDEIADQPDLQFLTCGDGKHELDCQHQQQQPNRAHFHLNLNHHPYNNNQDSSPGMYPDSLTPTNPPSSLSTQLRSANHELESLIMQHSPIKCDEYNSLPFESSQRLPSSQNQVDRSRSFSLNYQNGQHPTSPGTPNGNHSPHDFATRVSSLKKRHSYTASSSGSPPHNPPMFRRPRPLSFVENEDGSSGFDSPSFRAISQDVISLKTLLFRLQGVIQNAETQNPFESSFRALHHHVPQPNHSHLSNRSSLDSLHSHHERTYSNCSETSDRTEQENVQVLREENYDLRQHIQLMEQEMIEKDRTIRLLQQQMAKYSTGYVEPIPNGDTSDKSTELTNSTTQTETCETEDGINPRALSDGSSGQLVRDQRRPSFFYGLLPT